MKQNIACYTTISLLFIISILNVIGKPLPDDYININVDEAWNLLSDTSNGIQIPVDVRTDSEWKSERIDTSFPEDPRHYTLSKLQTERGLQEFISMYDGSDIILYCKSGGRSSSAASILAHSNFSGRIYNMVGGITTWKSSGYPTKIGNTPPYDPLIPDDPTICNINMVYNFSINISDPDVDAVRAGWDWNNDNAIDEWTSFYASGSKATVKHKWGSTGEYPIKVLVEDRVGDKSGFSDTLVVTVVTSNSPPSTPKVDGVRSGKTGETYNYSVNSTDPDGDDIYYYIDWGDNNNTGWLGPYNSGYEVQLLHSFSTKGTYTIRAKTMDQYGAESDWGTLKVSMPHNRLLLNTLFEKIFNYPFLHHFLIVLKFSGGKTIW